MRGVIESDAGEFFAAVFVGDDVVEDAIWVGDAREGEGDGAELDAFGDGLEVPVDSGQKAGMEGY